MQLTNLTTLPAAWTMGFQRDGRELLIVIVKGTYELPPSGAEARLAAEQVPLVEADQFSGEPGLSAPTYETDFAHRKNLCDVLLVGSAYAPNGRPATRTKVALRLGPIEKEFTVVGRRVWHKGVAGVAASDPEPFESLPITYDHAFGGTDRTREEEGRVATFLPNPVGKGYWRYKDLIDQQPLPYTEQSGHTVSAPDGNYVPMAFSPIGRNWPSRAKYAGTYDQNWIENAAPFWPEDFDERYFQAAPAEQTMPYLRGGEEVELLNLTPEGHRVFTLPCFPMPVVFIPHKGQDANREAMVDTIVLEPGRQRFTVTWRATLALARSVFDVRETIVGEPSAGWRRSRLLPRKAYYRTLDDLIRGREETS
jgi:hypothetical protein